jgi:hypothetical protein
MEQHLLDNELEPEYVFVVFSGSLVSALLRARTHEADSKDQKNLGERSRVATVLFSGLPKVGFEFASAFVFALVSNPAKALLQKGVPKC